ncbi:hypothetical protein BDW59DRAFT_175573 [Aspergillus cavernicola]|uniref:Hydantoinase/oxoprolinase n=1 Tax=Aspergillus cavernicola TaxID=176166 RepID=A0ABR4HP29_9EURO
MEADSPTKLIPLRIGVDVGGTNTDAVVLDSTQQATPTRGVLASHKTPTTPNATAGVESAIRAVLNQSGIADTRGISSVTIGTTAFLNSVIERDRRHLTRVAVLRLSKSFLRDVKPFSDWPPDLAAAIQGYIGYADGGLHIDGSEEAPVVEEQVVNECREIRSRGLSTFVIAGVYAPIDREFHQEDKVHDIVAREIPGADIVCSHEVANIGFLEHENASILNAAILRFAKQTIRGLQDAMRRLDLSSRPLYLTQNDGTLLDAATAARVPIRTFSSGVTNSMRGAAYLSGLAPGEGKGESAIVVDIGGTTTDVGVMLPSGLPRQASAYLSVAGINVNYSLPHLHSIGLGGGSIIGGTENCGVTVGPASVRSQQRQMSQLQQASRVSVIGDPQACKGLDGKSISNVLVRIKTMLEQAIDTVMTSPDPMPVFVTGGRSVLAPDTIQGASAIIRPPFNDFANTTSSKNTSQQSISETTEEAKRMAVEKAVSSGAVSETVNLDNQIRSVITAIGELDINAHPPQVVVDDVEDDESLPQPPLTIEKECQQTITAIPPEQNHSPYRSTWHISHTDLQYIADGCYLLGCDGGGNPDPGKLQLRDMLDAGHTGPDAVMALEIGGSNGMEPFLCGSTWFFDRPVVNGDFMGRTNPMCWQTTMMVHPPGEFMGSLVGLAPRPTTGEVAKKCGVLRSVPLAWRIGRAMARACEAKHRAAAAADAIVNELGGLGGARVLFRGKVAAVGRSLRKGFSVGMLRGELRIPFINENILAEHVAVDGTTRVLATVPDLIALIDRDSGRAVGVPEYRYGCHVVVLGIVCSLRWTENPRGLEVGGPKGYGYDLNYKPVGQYSEPRSVIDGFLEKE